MTNMYADSTKVTVKLNYKVYYTHHEVLVGLRVVGPGVVDVGVENRTTGICFSTNTNDGVSSAHERTSHTTRHTPLSGEPAALQVGYGTAVPPAVQQ